MNILRKLYRNAVKPHIPEILHYKLVSILSIYCTIYITINKHLLRYKILSYSNVLPRHDMSVEVLEIIDFLRNNSCAIYPYNFTAKYANRKIPTYYDSCLGMVYIVENDKKTYFKRGITKEEALSIYNSVSLEQDELSPHRYLTSELHMTGTIPSNTLTSGFTVNPGDVVVDLGVAEGNFAFSIVDIASKIYLFECDQEWIRALEATFKDYNDKVVIVPKYVSDVDDENNVSLDNYFDSTDIVNFIKADIEGYEWRALQGMEKILKRNIDIRASICTYHYPTDAEKFRGFFKEMDFEVNFTPGFMLYSMLDNQAPYLRRGILRAKKKLL